MDILKNKILNAIHEGLTQSFIIDDEPDFDDLFNDIEEEEEPVFMHGNTAEEFKKSQELLQNIASMRNSDICAAVLKELHIYSLETLTSSYGDEYKETIFNLDGNPYSYMPIIKITRYSSGFGSFIEIDELLKFNSWEAISYDTLKASDELWAERLVDMLSRFNLQAVEYLAISPDKMLMYVKEKAANVTQHAHFLLTPCIHIPVGMTAAKDFKMIPKDEINKALKAHKLGNIVSKYNYLPMRDTNGKLFYQTYITYKEKKNTTKMRQLSDEIFTNAKYDMHMEERMTIKEAKPARFLSDLNDGLVIEQYHEEPNIWGWRIYLDK